jgi:hypothetical protein
MRHDTKVPFGEPAVRREDNIKMNLEKILLSSSTFNTDVVTHPASSSMSTGA